MLSKQLNRVFRIVSAYESTNHHAYFMKKIILLTFLCLSHHWAVAGQNTSATVLMDLDMIYSLGDTEEDIDRNIGFLSDRVVRLQKQGLKAVQLAAFSNPEAINKFYTDVFFPTSHLKEPGSEIKFTSAIGKSDTPYAGNLFARAAKAIKLATNGQVEIYAWMPIFSYKIKPDSVYASGVEYVLSDLDIENNDLGRYKRLSPFSPITWDIVADIYAELAISAGEYIDGIAFHDDGMMSDHEDVSDSAVWFYRTYWGYTEVSKNTESITSNPELELLWATKKAAFINRFTLYMADVTARFIAAYHHREVSLKTTRHIYSSALLEGYAYTWLAQDPESLYRDYDHVSIEAYPFMEARYRSSGTLPLCLLTNFSSTDCLHVNEISFYKQLTAAAKKYDPNLTKTQFIFQSVDWSDYDTTHLPDQQFGGAMLRAVGEGLKHVGWYPDLYFPDENYPLISGKFADAINTTQ